MKLILETHRWASFLCQVTVISALLQRQKELYQLYRYLYSGIKILYWLLASGINKLRYCNGTILVRPSQNAINIPLLRLYFFVKSN